jgi:hypothetical protein
MKLNDLLIVTYNYSRAFFVEVNDISMRILLPDNLTKKTASEKITESVGREIFSDSFLSLIARQQNSNYKCQVYFHQKKKLECNSVRQFNEYVNHYDGDLLESDAFKS